MDEERKIDVETMDPIEAITALHMDYALVAKPDDHKKLTEWVDEMRLLKETTTRRVKDKDNSTRVYEWIADVPLNDNKRAPLVNYLDYMGEPIKNKRIHLGIIVLLFLGVLFAFAYALKRDYWKELH